MYPLYDFLLVFFYSAMDILQFPGLTVHHLAAALPAEGLARLEDHRLAERLKIEGKYTISLLLT